jgi:hypothetical protein
MGHGILPKAVMSVGDESLGVEILDSINPGARLLVSTNMVERNKNMK